jgi:hypothetical protein
VIFEFLLLLAMQQAPTLQHRPASSPEATAAAPTKAARSSLPVDADGEYQFGETGEVIELYVEEHALRGYLLKRSEPGRAASTPLTYDFAAGGADARAGDSSVHFTTRTVHGEFYSFTGSLVRGRATSPSTLGYYLLRGQLTLHQGAAVNTKSVVLERLGQH